MVNFLTQQIDTVFNPLIQNTNPSYQALVTQMGRIVDLFAPQQLFYQQIPHTQSISQIQNIQPLQVVESVVQRQQHVPQPQPVKLVIQEGTRGHFGK